MKRWRNEQGIKTGITTLTEIGGNDYNLIGSYIRNAYNNWDTPPVAVLLLSDYQNSGDRFGITSPYYGSMVSDNAYADMTGNSLPDLCIARITAQDSTHLRIMINKTLDYEREPYTDAGFYDHPVMAGGWQSDRWFILCTEIIYGYMYNVHGKDPVREYDDGPTSYWSTNVNTYMILAYFGPRGLGYIPSDPSYLTDWGGNASRINRDINQGAFLVQHRDHGSVSGWGSPSYYISDLIGLYNDMYPYVLSINCSTGKFNNSSPCFAEAFHRMSAGALGVVAASATSYSFVNDTYVWGSYDSMWPDFDPGYGTDPVGQDNLRPAFANASGKYYLEASSWPYNQSNKEITYYLFHHHGDAFMTLYSEVPQNLTVMHNPYILAATTSFAVTVDNGSLIGLSVNGEVVGSAEGTGTAVSIPVALLAIGETMRITVTKANFYRYIADVECVLSASQVPRPIDDLEIARIGANVELSWSPVVTDTSGNPITISHYTVFMSANDPFFVPTSGDSVGVVLPPNTNFVNADALIDPMRFYNVKAVAENE